MAYHDDTALDGRWETLCSRTSRRQDRPIQWPVPAVLRTDAYEAALAQRELGYKADEHFTRVPITLPFAWNVNPFRDKAWAIRLMCLQPMDAYFYAYDQTGQSAFLHDAIAILLDWCDFHIRKRQRSYMAWADMAVGYRALKLARVIDHLLSGELVLDQVAIDTILDGAVRHMTELLQPEKISLGNHGIFQMHALRVLGEIYWNCPLSDKAILFSEEKLQSLLYRQFNQEGMHLEHSAKYHFWMAAELRALLSSGWHNGDYFHALELNIEEAKNWLVDPSGNLVENGDTPPSKPPRLSVPPRPDLSTSAYQLRCFFDGGYAICRSPSAHLFFAAAYHSNAHKHADDLHVSLFDLGRRILVDSGTVGYKGDARREYVLSTRAHNTVEVDGQSYPRDGTDSYGSGLISAKGYTNGVELIGRVQHRSLSVVHERHLRYIPGKVLEVEDLLEGDVPRHFAQWFHFAPYFTVEVISPNSAVACAGDIRVELFSNCSIGSVVRGATNPMQGWTAQKIDVLEPSYALSFVARGTKAEIHTRVSIAPYDAHPVLGELLWSRECLN